VSTESATREPAIARQILKKLLDDKLKFWPEDGYFRFEGEGVLAKVLASVTHPIMVASQRRLTL